MDGVLEPCGGLVLVEEVGEGAGLAQVVQSDEVVVVVAVVMVVLAQSGVEVPCVGHHDVDQSYLVHPGADQSY